MLIESILHTVIAKTDVHLWWIGQSGFFIKLSNQKILLIDAYLSDSVERKNSLFQRLTPAPLEPEEIVCDYYLCTHNHLDHTDPDTISKLKNKEKITFIGPRNCINVFKELSIPDKNCIQLEAGQHISFDGFSLTATFCIPNGDKVLDSVGYVIHTSNNINIYHSGDTDYHEFLGYIKQYGINTGIVCINGKYGNLDSKQAYKLMQQLGVKTVIPSHFDMFPLNKEDPQLFASQFTPPLNCIIPEIGLPIIINNYDHIN